MPTAAEVEAAIRAVRAAKITTIAGEIKHRLKIITMLAKVCHYKRTKLKSTFLDFSIFFS
jgi:hypothetical protein